MKKRSPSPFQAAFLLTAEEKRYLLVVIALLLLGAIARHFYHKHPRFEPSTAEVAVVSSGEDMK